MSKQVIEITDSIIDEAEELAGLGMTSAEIAQSLEMARCTLYVKMKDDKRLADAIKRGRLKRYKKVTSKLMQAIDEGNMTAIIFFLKTKHSWKDGEKIPEGLDEKVKVSIDKLRAANDHSDT